MKNKKAQVYPAFVAVFTVLALTFAFYAIYNSKGIEDSSGKEASLGSKQAQVFYTLQDAESIKGFVDQAALNAAEKSFESMSLSCKPIKEWDLEVDGCNPYIHPSWSSDKNFCAPDCESTLKGNFEKELASELSKYEFATGKELPQDYELNFTIWPNAFVMSGISTEQYTIISLPARKRELYSVGAQQLFENSGEKTSKVIPGYFFVQTLNYEVQPNDTKSKYSFTPSFSVRVNKKIENPDEVRTWARETWNECTTDYRDCIAKKINEYNSQNNQYALSYASSCEERPYDLFFATMEKIEDCASNGFTTCACKIDLSSYSYDSDLVIEIKDGEAKLKTVEESLSGIKETEVEGASHVFSFAKFNNDALPTKKILLDFNSTTRRLTSVQISGWDDKMTSETIISQEGTNISFVKLKDTNPLLSTMQMTGQYEGLSCPDAKDKFRLCAKVKDTEANPEAFDFKFSLQMKKETSSETCKDLKIEVLSQNEKPDAMVKSIAEAAGFDYGQIISMIPIPGLNFLGVAISTSDILSQIPSEENANVKVVLSDISPETIGYQVFCGQQIPGVNLPQQSSVVLLDQKTKEIQESIRSSGRITQSNPYYEAVKDSKCRAPLAGLDGAVKEVDLQKAIQGEGTATFNINQCAGSQIGLDKLQKNKYCVTAVPIDSEGKAHPECKVTTCTEFNSLFDIALKKVLETQLKNNVFIPADLIPKDLKPYVKIPSNDDLIDAATGKKSLDLDDVVDTSEIESRISGDVQNMVLSELRREVTGTAFADAIDNLDVSKRQAVLAGIAGSIGNSDARELFEKIASQDFEVTDDSREILVSKSIDAMQDTEAKRIVQEIAGSEDPSSAAYRILTQKSTQVFSEQSVEQKRRILLDASNRETGRTVKDSILKEAKRKNCAAADSDVKAQLECLANNELDRIMQDSLNTKAGQSAVVKAQSEVMEAKDSVEALKGMTQTTDMRSTASRIITDEISKLPDSQKKEIISGILSSGDARDQVIQREIAKVLPQMNGKLDQIMNNGNIRALLEDELKTQLTKQLNLFKTGTCVDGNIQ